MTIRPFLAWPDKRLRQKAKPVGAITDDIRAIWDDMLETMYAMPGVGLAAPQIGTMLRLAVVDAEPAKRQPLCMGGANAAGKPSPPPKLGLYLIDITTAMQDTPSLSCAWKCSLQEGLPRKPHRRRMNWTIGIAPSPGHACPRAWRVRLTTSRAGAGIPCTREFDSTGHSFQDDAIPVGLAVPFDTCASFPDAEHKGTDHRAHPVREITTIQSS